MNDPAALAATFADFKLVKTRKLAQLVFEIPIEQADDALKTLGGLPRSDSERWCGIALMAGKPTVASPQRDPDRSERARERYLAGDEGERAVTRAALLCKDPEFQKWCERPNGVKSWMLGHERESGAAEYIRWALNIKSRNEIATNPKALENFKAMELTFLMETGRAASPMETDR